VSSLSFQSHSLTLGKPSQLNSCGGFLLAGSTAQGARVEIDLETEVNVARCGREDAGTWVAEGAAGEVVGV
jgi:hypothetical protein